MAYLIPNQAYAPQQSALRGGDGFGRLMAKLAAEGDVAGVLRGTAPAAPALRDTVALAAKDREDDGAVAGPQGQLQRVDPPQGSLMHPPAEAQEALDQVGALVPLEKQAFVLPALRGASGLAKRIVSRAAKSGTKAGTVKPPPIPKPGTVKPQLATAEQAKTFAPVPKAGTVKPAPAAQPSARAGGGQVVPPKPPPRSGGGPYREPAPQPRRRAQQQRPVDMTRHAKVVGESKPKGIVRTILPGAALLGAGYGLYHGVPAAANALTSMARTPMAYGGGFQQHQYGYTPGGQAQF